MTVIEFLKGKKVFEDFNVCTLAREVNGSLLIPGPRARDWPCLAAAGGKPDDPASKAVIAFVETNLKQ